MSQDLTGRKFGRLTVEKFDGYMTKTYNILDGRITVKNLPMWLCSCECGNTKRVFEGSLLHGKTRSCGCLRKEKARLAVGGLDKNAPRSYSHGLVTTGDHMRRAREAAKLTQEQLAEKAGLARGTLARLERNEKQGNLFTVVCLADALGVSLDEYIGREVPERIS